MKRPLTILLAFTLMTSCYGQTKKEYTTLVQDILIKKGEYEKSYNNSDSATRKIIIVEARKFLLKSITEEIFVYWF